jgi:hypothetical protein
MMMMMDWNESSKNYQKKKRNLQEQRDHLHAGKTLNSFPEWEVSRRKKS